MKFFFVLLSCLFILVHSQVQAKSAWNCFFTGVGEWAVPGLGYAITQQWDKTAIFGSLKWYSSFQYLDAASSEEDFLSVQNACRAVKMRLDLYEQRNLGC